MAQVYSYQKVTDEFTTYTVVEPDYKEGEVRITELCIIDSATYISVPDEVVLPEHPNQVVLLKVTPDEALYKAIEAASPHVQLINQRVADGLLTIAGGEAQKRILGYIPSDLTTILEKKAEAEASMKTSVWRQKTDVQLETYINKNWNDDSARKVMFKELVQQVVDMARRGEWDD